MSSSLVLGIIFFDIASESFMHIALSDLIIRLKGFLFSAGFLNLISNDYHIIETGSVSALFVW